MSIFGNILNKIFHHSTAKPAPGPIAANPTAPAPAVPAQPSAAAQPTSAPALAPATVDVGAVLEEMAAMKADHGGNYQSSIVDLLKLLAIDSSLSARKELAQELGVHAGEDGTAEQNIALYRAVIDKLADNGGAVPDSLRA